jgi:plastocyanin
MKAVAAISFAAIVVAMRPAPVERQDVQLNNNRFMPALVTARAGDTLAFINGRGGPHNVQFADDSLTDAAHRLIDAAMPDRPKVAWSRDVPLAGPLLVLEGDTYKVAVPELPPGRYRFFCAPHVSGGMRGELVVVP